MNDTYSRWEVFDEDFAGEIEPDTHRVWPLLAAVLLIVAGVWIYPLAAGWHHDLVIQKATRIAIARAVPEVVTVYATPLKDGDGALTWVNNTFIGHDTNTATTGNYFIPLPCYGVGSDLR